MEKTFTRLPHPSAVIIAACLSAFAVPAGALDIALTNDDGWNAPGIQVLKDALRNAGHTVTLAAPLSNQSGSSAAVDLVALRVTKQAEGEYSVALADGVTSAKPATSGLIAVGIVQETGRLPDLVVSGINAGNNLGALTQVSGTVGAAIGAIAASFNGAVPAIAISTDEPDCDAACQEHHYAVVADFVVKFIAHLETKPGFLASEAGLLPDGIGLNINYPPTDSTLGVKVATQGQTAQLDGVQIIGNFRCLTGACSTLANPGDSRIGGLQVIPDATPDIKNADTTYFSQGYVTIVPIAPDYTADSELKFKSVLTGFRP
jgi:5'-nucleotidase